MKVIFFRFSPSRCRIDQRSFLKSFSAKERRASGKAISKLCSKPLNASKPREEICKQRRIDNAVLQKTWRDTAKAPHLVPPQRRRTGLQQRGHLLRARSYDRRVQRGIFNYVSSAAANAGA